MTNKEKVKFLAERFKFKHLLLNRKLITALHFEDYERAAILRDTINESISASTRVLEPLIEDGEEVVYQILRDANNDIFDVYK